MCEKETSSAQPYTTIAIINDCITFKFKSHNAML